MAKVLLLNGSPKLNGNTNTLLREVQKTLELEGMETEYVHIGNAPVQGCMACRKCRELNRCVIDDKVNEIAQKLKNADGIVVGSPVYFASPNGALISLLDRLFFSANFDKSMKVGAAVVVARRGGCTAALDVLNKYFALSNMPIATSQYWNLAHGNAPEEAAQDAEGMQTMRQLALNMAFLIKSISLGRSAYKPPKLNEEHLSTNFIR